MEEKEPIELLTILAKHQADSMQGVVDADGLTNGVEPSGFVKSNPIPNKT